MATANGLSPYAHLVNGTRRSIAEWTLRLGHSLMKDLVAAGALHRVDGAALDEFVGLFEFQNGLQEYRLEVAAGSIKAHSSNEDRFFDLSAADVVIYEAKPDILMQKIASANRFTLLSPVTNQNSMFAAAERIIDSKRIKMFIVLDDAWINSFGAANLISQLSKGAKGVILVSGKEFSSFPWPVDGPTTLKVTHIPTGALQCAILRDWYCDPALEISTHALAEEFPEKKIIVDGVSKQIFILGRPLKISADSRTYSYFAGISALGSSHMATDAFAKTYLGYHQTYDANEIFRGTKTQARKALKQAFTENDLYAAALDLCMPSSPDKTVKSGFRENEVLFLNVHPPEDL